MNLAKDAYRVGKVPRGSLIVKSFAAPVKVAERSRFQSRETLTMPRDVVEEGEALPCFSFPSSRSLWLVLPYGVQNRAQCVEVGGTASY